MANFQSPPKRFRKDAGGDAMNPEPSLVVHVRQLSPEATEADLLEALQHFGTIAYVTMMPSRHMCLVEFEDLEGARQCVEYTKTRQVYVAGQPALFNYSTSKAISRVGLESDKPNHVLILHVQNAQYPIDVNTLHTICKPHGEVYRIAIIRKNGHPQALVEFDSIDTAKRAKRALNGADIYAGCCTLKVEYAKPERVQVTRNDNDQFDFTGPPDQGRFAPPGAAPSTAEPPRRSLLGRPDYHESTSSNGCSGGPPPPPQNMMGGGAFGQGPSYYGGGYEMNGGSMYAGGAGGYNQGGLPYPGGPGRGPYPSRPFFDQQQQHYQESGEYNPDRGRRYGPGEDRDRYGCSGQSCVMMVYGVDHEHWNCDKLFNLLCLYGNVEKIAFMKTKPDTVMVQMGSYQHMQQAIDMLYMTEVYDTKLALRPSKHSRLEDTREPFRLADQSPSFKDYTESRNQRFLTAESAAKNRIMRPSSVLHWYNAPANMTEERMAKIVEETGAKPPTKVAVFPGKSERSSAGVVEFEDTKTAVEALLLCNHTEVPSTTGRLPYILKFAFAVSRTHGGRSDRAAGGMDQDRHD